MGGLVAMAAKLRSATSKSEGSGARRSRRRIALSQCDAAAIHALQMLSGAVSRHAEASHC